jgi:hypothetical protein
LTIQHGQIATNMIPFTIFSWHRECVWSQGQETIPFCKKKILYPLHLLVLPPKRILHSAKLQGMPKFHAKITEQRRSSVRRGRQAQLVEWMSGSQVIVYRSKVDHVRVRLEKAMLGLDDFGFEIAAQREHISVRSLHNLRSRCWSEL